MFAERNVLFENFPDFRGVPCWLRVPVVSHFFVEIGVLENQMLYDILNFRDVIILKLSFHQRKFHLLLISLRLQKHMPFGAGKLCLELNKLCGHILQCLLNSVLKIIGHR